MLADVWSLAPCRVFALIASSCYCWNGLGWCSPQWVEAGFLLVSPVTVLWTCPWITTLVLLLLYAGYSIPGFSRWGVVWFCPCMRAVHAICMWDHVPFLLLFADCHMAFAASPWEPVPVDLGYCSASLSCYGLFKGACSLWLILYLLMYCWFPACNASLSCYFWSIYFLHLIKKKKKKPNDGGNGPMKSIPQQSKISMTRIVFKGIMWCFEIDPNFW